MPYKKIYKKKRTTRRRRTYKKRTFGGKVARRMQNNSLSYMKKKYTIVIPIEATEGSNVAQATISHIGGINVGDPASTLNLTTCNPDGMLVADSVLYQYFKITGVAFKLFFPEGTTPEATPVQWSMAYSQNKIIAPALPFERMQALQSYNTSSCDSSKPISRYFRTNMALKRLGIEWCPTTELAQFRSGGDLYNGQLPADQGSSTNVKVIRSTQNTDTAQDIGRIQLTYYVVFKGTKGINPITVVEP